MKKIILLLMAVFGMKIASAQYYFTTYGSSDTEIASSGITTVTATPGYMLVGVRLGSGPGVAEVNVVWTDLNGNLSGAPYLNKSFTAVDANTGVIYPSYATDVVESPVNNNFYIVGRVDMPGSIHPFLMVMDQTGVVVSFTLYNFAFSFDFDKVVVTNTNDGSGDVYIAALNQDLTAGTHSIVAERVDQAGNIMWSGIYHVINFNGVLQSAYGRDIIESPYPSQTGNPELYIFGATRSVTTLTNNPIMMIIDGVTGALQPMPLVEYDFGTDAEFTGVTLSNATGGFAVAGWYNNGFPDVDALTVDLQPLGAINWASHHDNTAAPGQWNIASGIKERLNLNGQYEYYTAGELNVGGTLQMHVLKIDAAGNVVPQGEFNVTSGTGYDNGVQLDFDPVGNGLAVFGNTMQGFGQIDMVTAKMYFNGVMPCNIYVKDLPSNPLSPNVTQPPAKEEHVKKTYPLKAMDQDWMDNQVCFAGAMADGDNTRVLAGSNGTGAAGSTGGFALKQLDQKVVISDNTGRAAVTGEYQVSLYDLGGRKVASFTQPAARETAVDLGQLGLHGGYYLMQVERAGELQHRKVFITH